MRTDMTIAEVMAETRLSKETLYRWLKSGKLKGYRYGGTKAGWRIPASEVERLKGNNDGAD